MSNDKFKKENELIKNTLIITIGKVCTQFLNFFLLPIYTSILSTSEYGTADLLISYSSLLLPIITLSIDQAIFRFLIDYREDIKNQQIIISTSIVFSLFQIAISTVILLIIQAFIHNSYMPYFIGMNIAVIASSIMLQLCRGLGDNIGYALGSFVTAAFQILLNIVLIVVFHKGAYGMVMATFGGNLACTIFLSLRIKVFHYIRIKAISKPVLKNMLHYSAPLVPNQLAWWFMTASDKTIVTIFLGTNANGILAVAQKFSSVFMQAYYFFNYSWTESAALNIKKDDAPQYFTRVVNKAFALFSCLCLGIIAYIPLFLNFLIDEKFYDAYYQIPILMLASLFNIIVSLYGAVYIAKKKTKEIASTAVKAALINDASHLALIKFIGLYAASISSLIGYMSMAIYRYFHSRKYMTIKLKKSSLIIITISLIICMTIYYSGNFSLKIAGAIYATIISIVMNINTLKYLFTLAINKIKKVKV